MDDALQIRRESPASGPTLARPVKWGQAPLTNGSETESDFFLPVGAVTLLLGDVEGSTRLWEERPTLIAEEMRWLSQAVSESVGLHNGVKPLEQGEGDSFVAAFARPSDAIACALDVQLQLAERSLLLRMGVHTGEVQLRGADNYAGVTVNRAARLRDSAHGGQVVLSAATRNLVLDHLPPDVTLLDLGAHHLKDLMRPEQIYQLVHPKLVKEFPPLRSLGTFQTNLPIQLTSFVGRGQEIEALRGLLANNRLVTLLGIGGCGKTRLALQVAAEMLEDHPGGTWMVDLSSATDTASIPAAIATALGIRETPGADLLRMAASYIGERPTLLVFDNCEHMIYECAEVAAHLLQLSQGARIMATSREPLGVEGEVSWRVPSLSLPPDDPPRIEGVAECEAVQLFVERARRTRQNFTLTETNAGPVARICKRLDGIPLAIEMAAARIGAFTPEEIATGLDDRFRLLTGGRRTAMPRQQTLRASIDWSYDLLDEKERILFRRLSVFSGGFTLAAAEAVGTGNGIEQSDVLDLLTSLIARSLVMVDDFDKETRYHMLETVRSYAIDRLKETSEHDFASTRHRDHFLSLVNSWMELSSPGDPAIVLALPKGEYGNFISALDWSRARSDVEELGILTHALVDFWNAHGPRAVGRERVQTALSLREGMSPKTAATLLGDAIRLTIDPNETISYGEQALTIAREFGTGDEQAAALTTLGQAKAMVNRGSEGISDIEEAVRLLREGDAASTLASALSLMATIETWFGEWDTARGHFEEAMSIFETIGETDNFASTQAMSAQCEKFGGEFQQAIRLIDEAIDRVDLNNRALRSLGMWMTVGLRITVGDYEGARRTGLESAEFAEQVESGSAPPISYLNAYLERVCGTINASTKDILAKPTGGFDFEMVVDGALAVGELERAKQIASMFLERVNVTGHPVTRAVILASLARISLEEGKIDEAENLAHEALRIAKDLRIRSLWPDLLETLARAAVEQESPQEAGRLFAGSEKLRESMRMVRYPNDRPTHNDRIETLRRATSQEEFEVAWAQGLEMSEEDLIGYAQRGRGDRKRPSHGWASLTPTELTVAKAVAEGLTNSQIAEKLFISPGTVRAHLSHIFPKLSISSRAELAAETIRRLEV